MATGLQEGEIKQAIAEGGHVRNVLVVSKCVGGHTEHLAYIRPSWRRDFLPLRTWQDKGDRTYRDLDRLLLLIRADFGYRGVVPVYIVGDPELARYGKIAHEGAPQSGPCPPDCDLGCS
ncbi:hypothetical protein [Sphingobium yanoikuyae]|uniref:hypothetical protein n=1 Tax=Sphingobium yanoikuyae TaxID=13690 RepID=UPI0004E2C366|nr:hypothetical protein [Sphingobium yanoikuyae]KFD27414.1 hypothetical protein IH86_14875 [Sphingobium yanoikuyae]MDV3480050.1 hypothetical protein [Sphingobium yanoikuyae]